MTAMKTEDDRSVRLKQLQREHQEMQNSLPKHSVPASMMIRLEELEDEIGILQNQLMVEDDNTRPVL